MKYLGMHGIKSLVAALLWLVFLGVSQAQEAAGNADFQVSGFLSITVGKTFGGASNADYVGPTKIDSHDCPGCYVADWSNGGVYTQNASLKPESRVGVQASYRLTPDASVTGQIVARGADPTPNMQWVQWAYGSYKLNQNWEIQLGRKRIPLYYYSDFQDVGISYPWVSPPPELYGWEVTNYNGASLRYSNTIGSINLAASVFVGHEKNKDSLYQRLYYNGQTEVTWRKILGADLEAIYGPITARGIYVQADVSTVNRSIALNNTAALKAYGLAVNLDFDQWFVLSELTQLSRDFDTHYTVTAPALTIGAGLRLGKWTPLLNYAQYKERSSNWLQYQPQSFRRSGAVLRYDLDASSAIKFQLDRQTDITNNFGGNANVVRISYDRVF